MTYLDNKYSKCYFNIIDRAKSRQLGCYVEKHHIVPKSLGGNNTKENMVCLTAREHFICHWLLTKMVEDGKQKWKMLYAFGAFLQKNKSQERLAITGRKYEMLKQAVSEASSNFNKGNKYALGHKQSAEHIKKIVESRAWYVKPDSVKKKQSNTMKAKYTNQTWTHAGKTYEEIYGSESAQARRDKLKGPRGPRKNPPGSQELVTCPHCSKTGGISNMKRYHFDNCAVQ